MDLETYFQEEPAGPEPLPGSKGVLTPWMSWGPFELRGKHVLVVDPSEGPDADAGLLVRLAEGAYDVSLKIMEYGPDRRIARVRVLQARRRCRLGPSLGTVRAETARIGLCDYELAISVWKRLGDEAAFHLVQKELRESHLVGFVDLDSDAEVSLPFVDAGFGAGDYSVFELLSGDIRVGLEIELIEPNAKYPFRGGAAPTLPPSSSPRA